MEDEQVLRRGLTSKGGGGGEVLHGGMQVSQLGASGARARQLPPLCIQPDQQLLYCFARVAG